MFGSAAGRRADRAMFAAVHKPDRQNVFLTELIVPPIVMDDHPNLAALGGNRGVVELGAGKGVHVHRLADQRAGDDVRQAEARLLHVHRRSDEHTSELQSLMRISYAVFCLKKKTHTIDQNIKYTSTNI